MARARVCHVIRNTPVNVKLEDMAVFKLKNQQIGLSVSLLPKDF